MEIETIMSTVSDLNHVLRSFVTTTQAREFLADEGFVVTDDTSAVDTMELALKVAQATSQAKTAAFLINATKGAVTNDDITEVLKACFPDAKVSERHGAHFASLSRSGKLAGCNYEVAKGGRSSSNAKNELAALKSVFEQLRDAKNMKQVRSIVNEYDGGGEPEPEPAADEPAAE